MPFHCALNNNELCLLSLKTVHNCRKYLKWTFLLRYSADASQLFHPFVAVLDKQRGVGKNSTDDSGFCCETVEIKLKCSSTSRFIIRGSLQLANLIFSNACNSIVNQFTSSRKARLGNSLEREKPLFINRMRTFPHTKHLLTPINCHGDRSLVVSTSSITAFCFENESRD